ncbi:MAG: hydroxymethylglutaryl-CoA lyase [Deltaproteobacteria bacterium]|nr:hydroxymethylglutaryl-CoA lyase [Deltaproteobacteria bacterium]
MEALSIFEVSPRDGLQNEAAVVSPEGKAALIEALVASGLRDIEITSFVRPRWIPQLSDAAELVRMLPRHEGVRYWALVPNQVGLERAIECGIHHVATFLSASETHNKKNVNRTVRESLASVEELIGVARDEGMEVRGYISTVFGCPYEGDVPVESTLRIGERLLAAGAHTLALGDTTGMADPAQVERVLEAVTTGLGVGIDRVAVHFHDTRGTALANAVVAYRAGVRQIDGSVGGMGGCPYAPGASGNAATEDLVNVFEQMGVPTGVDLDRLGAAGCLAESLVGRELPGRFHLYWKGARQRRGATRSA